MGMPSKNSVHPPPDELPIHYRVTNALARFFKGQISLAWAFWGYFFVGAGIFKGGAGIVLMLGGRTPQTYSLAGAVFLAYLAFSVIGVWRCANSHPLANTWVPIGTIVVTFIMAVTLISDFFGLRFSQLP